MTDNYKKYEMSGESKTIFAVRRNVKLFRVRALRKFWVLKPGDLGGWIESEENLSHEGNCWVADDAEVFDNAKIHGNAYVRGNAIISEQAEVYGDACVFGNACISGQAKIYGDTRVYHNDVIAGHECVHKRLPIEIRPVNPMPPEHYLGQFFDARKENPDVRLEIVSVFDETHIPSGADVFNSKGWYEILGNKVSQWEKNFRKNTTISDQIPAHVREEWNEKARKLIEKVG